MQLLCSLINNAAFITWVQILFSVAFSSVEVGGIIGLEQKEIWLLNAVVKCVYFYQ